MEVNINFEEASKAWRVNKRHIGGGFFVYTCNYIHRKNNKKCNRAVYTDTHCKRHMYFKYNFLG